MSNWIAVACKEHVQKGRASGFMQVCHGKGAPLQRLKQGDRVVYYSPTVTFGGKEKLQSFTAIGKIQEGEPFQANMGNGFFPFRRNVLWLKSQDAPIKSLIHELDFTKNKKNWGYQFRFGLIAINEHDMQLIANVMKIKNND